MVGELRRYMIWLRLLAKRLWKQPIYVMMLILIPILGCAVTILERGEVRGASVAVCVEESAWSGQIVDGLQKISADSVLQFEIIDEAEDVEQRVARAEADCGFVIGADIAERVMDGTWRKVITVYETSGSSITGVAKERVSGVIFQIYSEQCYEDYMRGISEEIWEFARDAYESHLVDGSTFAFQYIGGDQTGQSIYDTDDINDIAVFPVKGAFAVVVFISGMCGMLEYDRDRREKRFVRIVPNILTYIVDIWMPTVFVSAAVLVCLWVVDGLHHCGNMVSIGGMISVWGPGMWCRQILQLIAYQCIVVLYCGILGLILRRRETIAAAIPILSMGSLVCAPVFVRLAAYLPIFAVLEKLFPVSYYLMM